MCAIDPKRTLETSPKQSASETSILINLFSDVCIPRRCYFPRSTSNQEAKKE